jgi:short-chain fatty acids transporter
MQATRSSIPAALLPVTGVIPLGQTIFLWQSMVLAGVLIAVSVAVAYFSCPRPEEARTAERMGIRFEPLRVERKLPTTPGERMEHSPLLSVAVACLMVAYLARQFSARGGIAALDLNHFNLAFLALGLLLHGRPASFLAAVGKSVPATAGVLIQFPFYAGVFGLISGTSIAAALADWFVHWTTRTTFPRDLAGYSILQLAFHLPIVLFFCWLFAQTLPYFPPMVN